MSAGSARFGAGRLFTHPYRTTEQTAASAHQVDTNSSRHSSQHTTAPAPVRTPSAVSRRSPESSRAPTVAIR
ncbi:hypothetical protein RKD19_007362 [Streptomyces canus]